MVNRLIREGVKRKINYFCKFFREGGWGSQPKLFGINIFLGPKTFYGQNFKFFRPKIIVPKLYLKLEFDTEDQVLSFLLFFFFWKGGVGGGQNNFLGYVKRLRGEIKIRGPFY